MVDTANTELEYSSHHYYQDGAFDRDSALGCGVLSPFEFGNTIVRSNEL